eukprot:jgi/Galph1/5100/GphlegSOOS_G3723.1
MRPKQHSVSWYAFIPFQSCSYRHCKKRTWLKDKWNRAKLPSVGFHHIKCVEQAFEALKTLTRQSNKRKNSTSELRITAADFAVTTGLSVEKATQQLLQIASQVEGALDVSEQGEILYRIPTHFESILQRKRVASSLEKLWLPVKSALLYLIRISFGIFLLLSLVLVIGAIIFISSINSRRDDDNRSSFHSRGFFMGPSFSDLFFFFRGPSYYRYSSIADVESKTITNNKVPETVNKPKGFLEAAYSFLFGDGDPNSEFERKRWKTVANIIRANDCVVVAEQLAPYLLDTSMSSKDNPSTNVDESFMIPALVRFGGIPQVLEGGEIVYLFPELRKTARNVEFVYSSSTLPTLPLEKPIPFSLAAPSDLMMVGIVACLNLVGALSLGNMLSSPQLMLSLSRELGLSPNIISIAFQGLLYYAIAFVLVPLGRFSYIQIVNNQRKLRNSMRENAYRLLQTMSTELRMKIQAARRKAQGLQYIGEQDIIYASDKDLSEQTNPSLKSFDGKLSS